MTARADAVEQARLNAQSKAQAGEIDVHPATFDRPLFCDLLPVVAAILDELVPLVAKWAEQKVPWWIRWALGGIVANAVTDALRDAVAEYRAENCNRASEG